MRMFNRNEEAERQEPIPSAAPAAEAPKPQPKAEHDQAVTVIAAGIQFSDARFNSPDRDMFVYGEYSGSIVARALTIGPDARVSGEVNCQELIVKGNLEGEIRAMNVALHASCRIGGKVAYHRMAMKEGAEVTAALVCESSQHAGRGSMHAPVMNDGRPRLGLVDQTRTG